MLMLRYGLSSTLDMHFKLEGKQQNGGQKPELLPEVSVWISEVQLLGRKSQLETQYSRGLPHTLHLWLLTMMASWDNYC